MQYQSVRTVAGASLLSAAATLPLHLLPVLVIAVASGGALPPAQAGWIGSVYMLGQLAVVLLLPSLGVRAIGRVPALLAVILVVGAAALSLAQRAELLLAAWLVAGAMCGVLQYLANFTAAASTDRKLAFALRMAASSVLGSAMMAWLQVSRAGLVDYPAIVLQFAAVFGLIAAIGLAVYGAGPPAAAPPASRIGEAPVSNAAMPIGLALLFLLFVGQQGLWAVVMQGAHSRGFALRDVVWFICVSKLTGAAVVLAGALKDSGAPSPRVLLASGALVAGAGLAMGLGTAFAVFVTGLFAWEVALNVLSARYQAALASYDPARAGMWITASIFLGAASGHALAPAAAAQDLGIAFSLFAALAALGPFAWAALTAVRPATQRASHAADP